MTSSAPSSTFSGVLGLLVATWRHISRWHFTAPFESQAGQVTSGHLGLFDNAIRTQTIIPRVFELTRTQIRRRSRNSLALACDTEKMSLNDSAVIVEGTILEMPESTQTADTISRLQARITPAEFIARWERGENPMAAAQFAPARADQTHMDARLQKIAAHPRLASLVGNFAGFEPAVREVLEATTRPPTESIAKLEQGQGPVSPG